MKFPCRHHAAVWIPERGFYLTCTCGWQSPGFGAAPRPRWWIVALDRLRDAIAGWRLSWKA